MQDYPDLEVSGEMPAKADIKVTAQAREEEESISQGPADIPYEPEDLDEIPERAESAEEEILPRSENLETYPHPKEAHGGMLHDELFTKDTTEKDLITNPNVKVIPQDYLTDALQIEPKNK